MKIAKLGVAIAALAIAMAPALAFHDEGVAHCNGCHTMHNSQDGVAMNGTDVDSDGNPINGLPVGQGYPKLLLFPNSTDVCLACHDGSGSYHVWSADPLAPGNFKGAGDFVFLQEDNINDGHGGASNPILGHAAGHSVISDIKGTFEDPVLTLSPGGDYPSENMSCVSCHDPHGNTSFRLLYQTGQTVLTSTTYSMTWDATLDADGISLFGGPESNGNHNAYKSGYSEWCGNCHGAFHNSAGNLVHPSGTLLDTWQAQVYNKYQGTEDCIDNDPGVGTPCGSGTFGGAYLAAVPFEQAGMTTTTTDGATDGSSRVACVSCHRAHATSAPDAGRWDFNVTGLIEDGGASGSYAIPNPYPADPYQRSLCNKCHGQDEYDAKHAF